MAAPRPMAQTVQMILRGDFNGKQAINTFYWQYPSGVDITVANLQELSAWWIANVSNAWLQCISQDYKLVEITLVDLGHLPQTSYSRLLSPVLPGLVAAGAFPGNVAVGLRRLTAFRGKSYRGRIELPAVPLNQIVNDVLVPGFQTLIGNLLVKLLLQATPTSSPVFTPAVGSFLLVASKVITSWVFDLVSDSQKTRLLGHGN